MELKLIVLAGAKEGTQIPLKKEKFVIGRASECTLRAGSSAISRRHCAILRKDDAWFVRDLGSRNGTYLNDSAVQTPTPIQVGDEIRVGPLHFRVEQYVKSVGGSQAPRGAASAEQAKAAEPFDNQDINRAKQSKIKNIGEVVQRTVQQAENSSEDDVSRWLLGLDGGSGDTLRETQTLSLEETTAINRKVATPEIASSIGETARDGSEQPSETAAENVEGEQTEKSGMWSFFKKKAGGKKVPGKLPARPSELSKDSREAAADILREMTRRR